MGTFSLIRGIACQSSSALPTGHHFSPPLPAAFRGSAIVTGPGNTHRLQARNDSTLAGHLACVQDGLQLFPTLFTTTHDSGLVLTSHLEE